MEDAIRYENLKHLLYFVGFALDLLFDGALLFFAFSIAFQKLGERVSRNVWIVTSVYAVVYLVVQTVVMFPFVFYQGYVVEHQFGLSNLSLAGWFAEVGKGVGVGLVVGIIAINLLYLVLRKVGPHWWWMAAVVFILLSVVLTTLAPVLIMPLFNKYEPLKDAALREKILAMARDQSIQAEDVYQMDTSRQTRKVNAFVTGIGATKRIVIGDNLLGKMSHEEIQFVMAHEMGHYVKNHLWIRVGMISILLFVLFYFVKKAADFILHRYRERLGFRDLAQVASWPLLTILLAILGFILTPATNAISRQIEASADAYAIGYTERPEAAKTAFEKMAQINLVNPDPSLFAKVFFYDHPTLAERIAAAERKNVP